MVTIEVKTAMGNTAKIAVDIAKYKGASKEAFMSAELPFWRKGQPGVPEKRLIEVLGNLWDKTYGRPANVLPKKQNPPEPPKPKKSASKAKDEAE